MELNPNPFIHYASPEEILKFCNKVREAGGGEVINHLFPSIPQDDKSCLVATALNFDCNVLPVRVNEYNWVSGPLLSEEGFQEIWVMNCEDKVAKRISEALNLTLVKHVGESTYAVVLPERIGSAAQEFDNFLEDTALNDIPDHPFYDYLVDDKKVLIEEAIEDKLYLIAAER